MDPDVPGGLGNFFQGMLADMLRMLRTDSPLQWDLALQLAHSIAVDGGGDANVEPFVRMQTEELARIAELHVADVSGLTLTSDARPVEIVTVAPSEWARRTLESWRPLLEELATALGPTATPEPPTGADEEGAELSSLLGQWAGALAPAMTAMQVGSVVGHLSRRCLGQYELPVPRASDHELLVVAANVERFAHDWSLPEADVRLWCLVRDLAVHVVLVRPHVRARMNELLIARARGLKVDPQGIERRLGEIDPSALGDMNELARLFADPGTLAELQDTPEQRRIDADLRALASAVLGYAAYVTDTVALRAIGAGVPVREAMRRAQMERGDEARAGEAMLGLHLDADDLDAGRNFVDGVLARGGEAEVARLWQRVENLPTPSEIEAPGLWIERIHLDDA